MDERQVVERIFRREGWDQLTNDPADHGGLTRFGITKPFLSDFLGRTVYDADIRELTQEVARRAYGDLCFRRPGFDLIGNDGLQDLLVDSSVQWNPRRATRWLQAAVAAPEDGVIGPITLKRLERMKPERVFLEVFTQRLRARGRRITDDPTQARFAAGWANRDAELLGWLMLSGS